MTEALTFQPHRLGITETTIRSIITIIVSKSRKTSTVDLIEAAEAAIGEVANGDY